MRIFILISILLSFTELSFSQCDTNALVIHKVTAQATDNNIPFELVRHHAFYNPLCTSKNTLLFYMVGTIGKPSNDLYFTKMAANNGYHVISIKYLNDTSATTLCSNNNDTLCYENFHKEAIFGTDASSLITIDSINSIYNRSLKLIEYLSTNFPTENWGQFLNSNTLNWAKIITAGHSQGSGHAAYLAYLYPVKRTLMFSGPNEYMNNYNRIASWFLNPQVTVDSNFYSFGNINDEVGFNKQLEVWEEIGMNNYGDTIDATQNNCPFNNRKMLYTPDVFTGIITPNHNSTMVDNFTPVDGNGVPEYEEAWKYMLDLCGVTTNTAGITPKNKLNIYPNPTKNKVYIETDNELKNIRITITNILGEISFFKEFDSFRSQQLDINHLKQGIYLMNISADNFSKTTKLIVR